MGSGLAGAAFGGAGLADVVRHDVSQALAEDIGAGDCTAELIPAGRTLQTRVTSRGKAILAGSPWFDACFHQLNEHVSISWAVAEGDAISRGQIVCKVDGPARAILTGERTALNFLQTLSATASRARQFVDQVAGTKAIVLDTRKTLPGLRWAQKHAVRCGGAHNHRMGLFDAVLIKENHIAATGSITAAVNRALELSPGLMIEVEVECLDQLAEAAATGARRALLDNFTLQTLVRAVHRFHGQIELEASGNINLGNVRSVAETGVDYISIGDMTKNIEAVDFSMRFF